MYTDKYIRIRTFAEFHQKKKKKEKKRACWANSVIPTSTEDCAGKWCFRPCHKQNNPSNPGKKRKSRGTVMGKNSSKLLLENFGVGQRSARHANAGMDRYKYILHLVWGTSLTLWIYGVHTPSIGSQFSLFFLASNENTLSLFLFLGVRVQVSQLCIYLNSFDVSLLGPLGPRTLFFYTPKNRCRPHHQKTPTSHRRSNRRRG